MAAHSDIREFLAIRRARLTLDQVDLPDHGARRRVPGLRREEVALLAGISVEYYTRLERGIVKGVSARVLEGLGRALQLDDLESEHLRRLVEATDAPLRRRPADERHGVQPALQQLLDAMNRVPAIVQNGRFEVIASNGLGAALYSEVLEQTRNRSSFPRYVFLDPRSRRFYREWDEAAELTVALLRTKAGQRPHDRALHGLIGELSAHSDLFRSLWAEHHVREHRSGTKKLHHPLAGDLELSYEGMMLQTDRDLVLTAYTAEPGSPSHGALKLLSPRTADEGPEVLRSDQRSARRPPG